MNKRDNMQVLPSEESAEFLKGILLPVAEEIAEVREALDGIVFVVHNPGKVALQAMTKLGVEALPNKTMVFGLTCPDATTAFGHDPITRRWCNEEPGEDQIKVFLMAGDGTALLTLEETPDGTIIHKESDLAPVP